jgi:hypothetical protein
MQLTPQQESVVEHVSDLDSGSLAVKARAGSGKTFILVRGMKPLPRARTGLAVAFNVRIKDEIAQLVPPQILCKTLNGVGHGAWLKYIGKRAGVDARKIGKITGEVIKEAKLQDENGELWTAVKDLVGKAKVMGLVPKKAPGAARPLLPDEYTIWEEIATNYDIDFDQQILEVSRVVLTESIKQAFLGEIDFDDQLYMPVCWSAPFSRFPDVFVDEAQDLSPLQHEMVARSSKERIIAVGDPRQAIYGFRGAKEHSMQELQDRFDMKELFLTVSFRCSKAVIQEAQQSVPDIEAWDGAKEGSVQDAPKYTEELFPVGSAILCRNNAPLIRMAFRLIAKRVGVRIIGRDIGVGLKLLVNKISHKSPHMAIGQFNNLLEGWLAGEIATANAKDNPAKASRAEDRYESLHACTDAATQTVGDLLRTIEELFARTSGIITLSTGHKAKGLEWNDVFILDPFLLPEPNTKDHSQGQNLRYVMTTRSQENLTFISTKGWYA